MKENKNTTGYAFTALLMFLMIILTLSGIVSCTKDDSTEQTSQPSSETSSYTVSQPLSSTGSATSTQVSTAPLTESSELTVTKTTPALTSTEPIVITTTTVPAVTTTKPITLTTTPKLTTSIVKVTSVTSSIVTTESDFPYTPPQIDESTLTSITLSTDPITESIDVKTSASSVLIYDLSADSLIYTTDMNKIIYPASTAKIITALYALTVADPDDVFTVGNELSLVAQDASVAKLRKNQKITFEHCLYAMLLPSGNDAAYVVAANVGRMLADDPDISAQDAVRLFVMGMNEYAKHIGMSSSSFNCPDGYHDVLTYTTLHDMMIATKAATQNELIMQVASTPSVNVKIESGQSFEWFNSNYLLEGSKMENYVYEGAIGLKTGYTSDAGACLISIARRDNDTVAVLLFGGSSKIERYPESAALLDFAFEFIASSDAEEAA